MLQVQGLNYAAIIVRDMEESVRFYRRLGLQLLYGEPNRDDAESITAMLYCGGNDTFLQLVGPIVPGSVNIPDAIPGVGSTQYLSFMVALDQMEQIWHELSTAGVQGSEMIERGFERLVFLEDPNGVLVILTAWGVEPPPGLSRVEVLRRAAALREQEQSPFIEDEHVEQAIAELQAAGEGE